MAINVNKAKEVLKKQIFLIKPSKQEIVLLKQISRDFVNFLEKQINRNKIKAKIVIGGSLAKNTIIKKHKYDIDIFVRFDKKYKDKELSGLLEKILKKTKEFSKNKIVKIKRVHGSRDYFRLEVVLKAPQSKIIKNFAFEIVPVVAIKKPEEARNVTDLSFFHINYIKNQIKKKPSLAEEIMLAKTFCYAQHCYGAESYIRGFSGYALELLICYYKSFFNFISKIIESKTDERIVIDMVGFYKNKKDVLLNLNEAKLQSPIVFVDPTYKLRNAIASLSRQTFEKFKNSCRRFLQAPNQKFFEKCEVDVGTLKKKAKKSKATLIILYVKTNKQEGSVAGAKLLKFFNFLERKLQKYFIINKKIFQYNDKKTGKYYFILKSKKKILVAGPPITSVENLARFKKKHKKAFIKKGRAYAYEKPISNINKFLEKFKKENKKVMAAMGIMKVERA